MPLGHLCSFALVWNGNFGSFAWFTALLHGFSTSFYRPFGVFSIISIPSHALGGRRVAPAPGPALVTNQCSRWLQLNVLFAYSGRLPVLVPNQCSRSCYRSQTTSDIIGDDIRCQISECDPGLEWSGNLRTRPGPRVCQKLEPPGSHLRGILPWTAAWRHCGLGDTGGQPWLAASGTGYNRQTNLCLPSEALGTMATGTRADLRHAQIFKLWGLELTCDMRRSLSSGPIHEQLSVDLQTHSNQSGWGTRGAEVAGR